MAKCHGITNAGPCAPPRHPHAGHDAVRGITDAGFAHLAGIHSLNMAECWDHRRGPCAPPRHPHTGHALDALRSPTRALRTSAASTRWNMRAGAPGITDAGVAHLRGIHTLDMSSCPGSSSPALRLHRASTLCTWVGARPPAFVLRSACCSVPFPVRAVPRMRSPGRGQRACKKKTAERTPPSTDIASTATVPVPDVSRPPSACVASDSSVSTR
jgi:hypothetical protein